jgi:hypothetical protein
MNFAKRLLMVVGIASLAGTVGALLAPKTAHALVATLVHVENTTAQPVPTRDVDNPAYEPFVGRLCAGVVVNCGGLGTSFVVPTTDANSIPVRRLVIEYYSTECMGVTPSEIPRNALLVLTGGQQNAFYIGPLQQSSNATDSFYYSNQQTRIYAEPGSNVLFDFFNDGGSPTCNVTVTGYLVI